MSREIVRVAIFHVFMVAVILGSHWTGDEGGMRLAVFFAWVATVCRILLASDIEEKTRRWSAGEHRLWRAKAWRAYVIFAELTIAGSFAWTNHMWTAAVYFAIAVMHTGAILSAVDKQAENSQEVT